MASITIKMGNNPQPTATITSGEVNFNGSQVTVTFSYKLNAMSGYNYWGYGVKLEYGSTSSLGSSITLRNTSPSQWNVQTGTVTITKNANTSPQDFYFRLNSLATTSGAPGATGSISVSFNTKSSITGNTGEYVEGAQTINFSSHSSAFYHALKIECALRYGNDFTEIKTIGGYNSGSAITFDGADLIKIYDKLGVYTAPNATTQIRFTLQTYTGSGGSFIGSDSVTVVRTLLGTAYTKVDDTWKTCLIWVKNNNVWKPCVTYENINKSWKLNKTV